MSTIALVAREALTRMVSVTECLRVTLVGLTEAVLDHLIGGFGGGGVTGGAGDPDTRLGRRTRSRRRPVP